MSLKAPAEVERLTLANNAVTALVAINRAERGWISCDRDIYLMFAATAPANANNGLLLPADFGCDVEIPAGMGLWVARAASNNTIVRIGLYGLSLVPLAPTVEVGDVTDTTVELDWADTKGAGAGWRPPATAYRSRYRTAPIDGKAGNWTGSASNDDLTREFTGLTASTRYEFGVAATNARGQGAETITAITTEAP